LSHLTTTIRSSGQAIAHTDLGCGKGKSATYIHAISEAEPALQPKTRRRTLTTHRQARRIAIAQGCILDPTAVDRYGILGMIVADFGVMARLSVALETPPPIWERSEISRKISGAWSVLRFVEMGAVEISEHRVFRACETASKFWCVLQSFLRAFCP
jgi:hypothetical protein